jgi:hypothetical protein
LVAAAVSDSAVDLVFMEEAPASLLERIRSDGELVSEP